MPTLNAEINDIVQGDCIDINRSIGNLPAPLTKAWFTVKISKSSPTDVFQKVITTSNVAGQGVIGDDGTGDGVAQARFELTNANTVLLTDEKVYYYDIQVLTSTSKIYTPELGLIRMKSERTKATS